MRIGGGGLGRGESGGGFGVGGGLMSGVGATGSSSSLSAGLTSDTIVTISPFSTPRFTRLPPVFSSSDESPENNNKILSVGSSDIQN